GSRLRKTKTEINESTYIATKKKASMVITFSNVWPNTMKMRVTNVPSISATVGVPPLLTKETLLKNKPSRLIAKSTRLAIKWHALIALNNETIVSDRNTVSP